MIEKINKYWNIMMILILIFIIIYIFSVFIFGGLAMDKGVGKYHYSKSLEEAKKENGYGDNRLSIIKEMMMRGDNLIFD
ncbi:hypothetical protein ODZ84_07465 [Chryseobacterium fluminis]|uniref:hypothetical protein n=1 Tax=Chryseobacterium fluminis TaxID=2983606 RepID=UPI0022513CB7|nr:hypothetical protein [Chryseobacterium sp. MMS21-Ot14]UZT99392.1 hypothetical protein ODZ84_07465 [Chryseobacterium sp. MMS21-Ot14]